jgi:hypothetical protein
MNITFNEEDFDTLARQSKIFRKALFVSMGGELEKPVEPTPYERLKMALLVIVGGVHGARANKIKAIKETLRLSMDNSNIVMVNSHSGVVGTDSLLGAKIFVEEIIAKG